MNLSRHLRFFGVLTLVACVSSSALAAGNLDRAGTCFNNADFKCAFKEAKRLARRGKIVVGHDHRTTDSMTFYQMAMVEYFAIAGAREKEKAALFTLKTFGRRRVRLPFSVAFGYLSIRHDYVVATGARKTEFDDVICDLLKVTPSPTWRKLTDTNPLSPKAKAYFRSVMRTKPACAGSARLRTPSWENPDSMHLADVGR